MERNRNIRFSVQRDGNDVLVRFDLATVLELVPSLCFVADLMTSEEAKPPNVEEENRARALVALFLRTVSRDVYGDFTPEELRRAFSHEVPI